MNELTKARLIEEDTVLPAVPLSWGELENERAQLEIDHLGSGAMATEWGSRIISNQSALYDPLSYHYGSVWPLFTGWAAMGAYRYGRPHAGYHLSCANALLSFEGALGYVTELLSGDFNADFGRSSHHQIWSEAMVVTPIMRGMLGVEVAAGGAALTFAPQLPADWTRVQVRNIAASDQRFDLMLERREGSQTIKISRHASAGARAQAGPQISQSIKLAPAFPLDATIRSVTVNGRPARFNTQRLGDVMRAEVTIADVGEVTEVVYAYDEGTDVYAKAQTPQPGARNQGLRILRSWADASALHLRLEGLGGRSYPLGVRSSKRLGEAAGVRISRSGDRDNEIVVSFDGPAGQYIRRDLTLPLATRR